jgi:hypothetical protein
MEHAMIHLFTLIAAFLPVPAEVPARFTQVAPVERPVETFKRTPSQRRAVVLIQGLYVHPFSSSKASEAKCHSWQKPDSDLVKSLASEADVFSFAYAQLVEVERVAGITGLAKHVRRLKELGYEEIILIGHSAGGLIARQLVEDDPACGVSKVIQVCPPNGGSSWANHELAVRKPQEPFLESLTKPARQRYLAKRKDKRIPDKVEFVVVMGKLKIELKGVAVIPLDSGDKGLAFTADASKQGDGVVSCESQWPEDLQKQAIPVVAIARDHFSMMRCDAACTELVQLVRNAQPRWKPDQVEAMRRKLAGD